MGRFVVYEIENINTGEKIIGTGVEIAGIFGVTRAYISQKWSEDGLIRHEWKLKRLDEKVSGDKCNNESIPQSKRDEWDETTAPFKRLSEKKAKRVSRA